MERIAETGVTDNTNKGKVPGNTTLQLWIAVGMITAGCVLLGCGFMFPPKGEIHSSVLVAFGEILTFAGALFGIDYKYKSK